MERAVRDHAVQTFSWCGSSLLAPCRWNSSSDKELTTSLLTNSCSTAQPSNIRRPSFIFSPITLFYQLPDLLDIHRAELIPLLLTSFPFSKKQLPCSSGLLPSNLHQVLQTVSRSSVPLPPQIDIPRKLLPTSARRGPQSWVQDHTSPMADR